MTTNTHATFLNFSTAGRFLSLAGVGTLLVGCASLGPQLTNVWGEGMPDGRIEVTSIQTRVHKTGGILVLGDVRSRGPSPAPVFRHFDVYAQDATGHTVAARATQYPPRPIPPVRHGYENRPSDSVRLAAFPEVVKTVRVVHHPAALSEFELRQTTPQ